MMGARLERSVLIVPGSNPNMIAKAAAADADAICIDLEDAVAPDAKETSRGNVVDALTTLDFGAKLRCYRINGLDTEFAYRDLIDVLEPAGHAVDIVIVPKVNGPDDIRFVDTLLSQIEARQRFERPIGIEALIETAAGCINIREIAAASPRLEGLIYGAGDYAASLRMPLASIGEFDDHDALYPGHRWHFIMHAIVSAARAFDKRAIDSPFAGIKNAEGLEQACAIARAMGFDGKWCIHPSQIATANQVFGPAEAEICWAETVLSAYDAAMQEGRGAITVGGKMVDAANLRMATTIVERARLAGLRP